MTRKIFIILAYTLYLFIFLGLVFHTSSHPQVFGKYTVKYLLGLSLFVIGFVPFLFILLFLSRNSVVTFRKKKYIFTPLWKAGGLVLLIALLILPMESFLRNKYSVFETSTYAFTRGNFHPFLQFQLTPQSSFPVNSYNFRAREISLKKSADTYRIFVLGGSTVLNTTIPYEKILTTLLESKLQKQYPERHIEVVNGGNDGYTSEHSLIQYLFKIRDFDPDLIIMWHGINDWYYSCSPEARADGPFKADYSHFYGADSTMVSEHFRPPPIVSVKLLTLDFISKFFQQRLFSDILDKLKYRDPDIYISKTASLQYSMTNFPSLKSYKRNLQELIDQTKVDNVTLLLGNQPVLYSTNLDSKTLAKLYFPKLHCTVNGKYPSLTSVIKGMNTFNTSTKELAEKNSVPFVDLDAGVPKNLTYYFDDVHYTGRGNARVADLLFQAIQEQQLVH